MINLKSRILLAEDDKNLGLLLREYLTDEGFEVTLAPNGHIAAELLKTTTFDLLLFDVMMPEKDGFTLAKEFRKTDKTTPLIFTTAKSQKTDKLIGYQTGADDYITKPFDEEELVWKIKALLRRNNPPKPEREIVKIGNSTLDPINQLLLHGNSSKRLTERECQLLSYLIEHQNLVVKREDLLKKIWGKNDYFLGRSLDVFISKLRKYLAADDSLSIESVFGVGFVFNTTKRQLPQNQ